MNNKNPDKRKEMYEKLKQINDNLKGILDETDIPSEDKEEEQEEQEEDNNSEDDSEKPRKFVKRREVIRQITVPVIDRDGNPIRMIDGKFVKDDHAERFVLVKDEKGVPKERYLEHKLIGEPIRLNFYEKYKWLENGYTKKKIKIKTKKGFKKTYVWVKEDYSNLDINDNTNPEVKYKDALLDDVEEQAEQREQENLENRVDDEEFDIKKSVKNTKSQIKDLERAYSDGEINEDDFNSKYNELLKKKGALEKAISKQHGESGYIIGKLNDAEKTKYKDKEKELAESGKPLVTLYVEKAFLTDKWLFLVPGAKATKENWKVQGRPGWEIPDKGLGHLLRSMQIDQFLGQPKQYSGCEQDEVFTHYVYMEDHRKENSKRELMYKMSSRKKLHEGKDEDGNPYYSELWKYTKKSSEKHHAWEVINRISENFRAENAISEKIGSTYRGGKDGLLSLNAEAMEEELKIFERSKSIREILDIGRSYFMTLPFENIPADLCEIDKDVFASFARGTQFSVIDKGSKYLYAKIKKDRYESWPRSGLSLLMPFKDKHRLGKWKMENYKIEIYDKNFAGSAISGEDPVVDNKTGALESDYLAGMLAMFTPMLEREREYHSYRFKFKGKPGKDHPSIHKGSTTYETFQKYPLRH